MEGETPFTIERGPEAIAPPPVRNHAAEGVAFAAIGFAWWGSILPIYLWIFTKKFATVTALEIVAHRIIWGLPILALMLTHGKQWGTYRAVFRNRVTLTYLCATTALIGVNWFTYTWAVGAGRLSEASLGYYINPLVSVALGMIFLGERARPAQWVAFALAAAGVAHETMLRGGLPWVSLTLAFSFGFYGLLRKKVKAEATVGLAIETTLLYIPSLALLGWMMARGQASFGATGVPWWVTVGVMASGFMTVVPLVCYTAGARRLRLSTIGFLQYIAPTGQFILAVTMFGEEFNPRRLITFLLIWIGLAVFSVDSVRAAKRASAKA
jgi:chloramphenicol-sensitive protein RarD